MVMPIYLPPDAIRAIIEADRRNVSEIENVVREIGSIVRELDTLVKHVVAPKADPRERLWWGQGAIDFRNEMAGHLDGLGLTCVKLQNCAGGLLHQTVALEREFDQRLRNPVNPPGMVSLS